MSHSTQDPRSDVWEKDRQHFIHPYMDFSSFHAEGSQVISRASGIHIQDEQGRQYLDAIAGLWCVNIGHGREEMAQAIAQQVRDMQYYNPFGHSTNEPAALLAAKLAQLAPGDLNHVFFSTGGSTANDAALRMIHYYFNMRGLPGKKKIIARVDAYHGSTYITANLTGIQATKIKFDRLGDELIRHVSTANLYRRAADMDEAAYCDHLVREFEDRVLQMGADTVAAFFAEPIMGAGGVLMAPRGYHARIKAVCERYDILYVADEVVTAFGRLGAMVSSQDVFGVTPDILTVAKGITSGYIPLGATILSDQVFEVISQPQCEGGVFSMGYTYSGHAVACAAALKNIEILEREALCAHVQQVGPYLQQRARSELLDLPCVGDVRGSHLMLGVELVADKHTKQGFAATVGAANRVFQHCREAGVIVRPIGNVLVVSPPLILGAEDCDTIVAALQQGITAFARELA